MELSERIRVMRMFKGWTQDEMAAKLHMAVNGYAKIERGETDIPFSRLQQIVKTFEIELADLIGLNEKNVLSIVSSHNTHAHADNPSNSTINVYSCEAAKFQHEKSLLIIEQKDKEIEQGKREIALLQQQVNALKEMIQLLKNTD